MVNETKLTPIAIEVKELRESFSETQATFAKRCGLSQPTIHAVETAKFVPHRDTILSIAVGTGRIAILGAKKGKVFLKPGK